MDYGKTRISYPDARKKRSVGPAIPFSTVQMENIDNGKTGIKYLTKRSYRR